MPSSVPSMFSSFSDRVAGFIHAVLHSLLCSQHYACKVIEVLSIQLISLTFIILTDIDIFRSHPHCGYHTETLGVCNNPMRTPA